MCTQSNVPKRNVCTKYSAQTQCLHKIQCPNKRVHTEYSAQTQCMHKIQCPNKRGHSNTVPKREVNTKYSAQTRQCSRIQCPNEKQPHIQCPNEEMTNIQCPNIEIPYSAHSYITPEYTVPIQSFLFEKDWHGTGGEAHWNALGEPPGAILGKPSDQKLPNPMSCCPEPLKPRSRPGLVHPGCSHRQRFCRSHLWRIGLRKL